MLFSSPLSSLRGLLAPTSLVTVATFARCLTGSTSDVFNCSLGAGKYRKEQKYGWKSKTKNVGNVHEGKKVQEWDEWDGFGPYKYKPHYMANNMVQRDVQRRRILGQHAEERMRLNCIRKASILPTEIRNIADQEIQKVPRASSITRVNRRCTITGRPRGIFHQYRVSRFIFRAEADYNKVSGVQRAIWIKGTEIEP